MTVTPPAGWYPDPHDAGAQRFWDGVRWTAQTGPGRGWGAGSLATGGNVLPRSRPPLAGLGSRFAARLVDGIVVGAVLIALLLLMVALVGTSAFDGSGNDPYATSGGATATAVVVLVLWYLVAMTAPILYETLMIRRDGQTLGKKLLRIRVVRAADGATPSGGAALGRCMVGVLGVIDAAFALFDRRLRQCLHDRAASTVVVAA